MVKDIDYALITPHGSKDRLERRVDEWFGVLDEAVKQERMPQQWVQAYKNAYSAWKEGREVPLEGTSVRNWPLLTPAQVENCINLNVRTVEDLAAANEELLGRLGMGGRALKDKASAWLATSGSDGAKTAERVSQLEASNRQLTADNKALTDAITTLRSEVRALRRAPAAAEA